MLQLKKTTFEDEFWPDIRQIRDRVFIDEQEVSPEEEFDEYEQASRHFLALLNGKPAGTARWRQTEKGVKLERFAVLKEYRKYGVGMALVKEVLADVLAEIPEPKLIYLHAQSHAISFYEKCGFVAVGEEFSEANILHRKMYHPGFSTSFLN